MQEDSLDHILNKDKSIPMKMLHWLPILSSMFIGLVFIGAAIIKSMDVDLFTRQIMAYGLISNIGLIQIIAWGLIVLELILGVGLLVSYRPNIFIPGTGLILLFFIFANIWVLFTGTTSDCGCFGSWLQRSPGEAIAEDIILITIIIVAWYGRKNPVYSNSVRRLYFVLMAFVAGLILPFLFGFSISNVFHPEIEKKEAILEELNLFGLDNIDINSGEYLLVIMSTECEHCQDNVFELNILNDKGSMPKIIALCADENDQIKRFKHEFEPHFPIGRIPEDEFWSLLGMGDIPRIIHIKNRHILQIWDGYVPTEEEIKFK